MAQVLPSTGSGTTARTDSDPLRQVRQSELNAQMEREDILNHLFAECQTSVLSLDSLVARQSDSLRVVVPTLSKKEKWNKRWKTGFVVAVIYGLLKSI